MSGSEIDYHFAFEHFEREVRPVVIWRVVFSTAAGNANALQLTRYYSGHDAKEKVDAIAADKTKRVISVDKYVMALNSSLKDQKLAIVNTMPTAAQESPKQGT